MATGTVQRPAVPNLFYDPVQHKQQQQHHPPTTTAMNRSSQPPLFIPNLHLGNMTRNSIADFDFDSRYPSPAVITPPAAGDYQQRRATMIDPFDRMQVPVTASPIVDSMAIPPLAPVPVGSGGTPNSIYEPPTQDGPPQPRQFTTPSAGPSGSPQSADLAQRQDTPAPALDMYPSGPSRHPTVPVRSSLRPLPQFPASSSRQQTYPAYGAGPGPAGGMMMPVMMQPPANVPRMPPPPEEVCIECKMRDLELADVDVTGPGVWDRESDVWFQELVKRDMEDEKMGIVHPPDPKRKSSRGHYLTEANLRIWLLQNPKESAGRWATMEAYIKSQAALLEAESRARAEAAQESRVLESRMRDTYTQLRRSAYDTGAVAISPGELDGAPLPIKPPRAHPETGHIKRDMSLLENGMIVEHVDVKREEREAERRRRERKTSRKSSGGGGGADVASIYSSPSGPIQLDGPPGSPSMNYDAPMPGSPQTAYLQPSSPGRPMSMALGSPRPQYDRGNSNSSIDTKAKGRFFGFRHWSGAWGSDASVAHTGSMANMHGTPYDRADKELGFLPPVDLTSREPSFSETGRPRTSDGSPPDLKPKKKKKGIGKLWKIFTGSKDDHHPSLDHRASRMEEDLSTPLAPPPPLSFLVNRGERGGPHARHMSTPSLPTSSTPSHPRTATYPAASISPPTAPSSLLPSPTSNRFPWRDSGSDDRRSSAAKDEPEAEHAGEEDVRSLHPVSEPSAGSRHLQVPSVTVAVAPASPNSTNTVLPRPMSMINKSLPPLPPGETAPIPMSQSAPMQLRPQSAFIPGPPRGPDMPDHGLTVPIPGFRSDGRRQSFGGMTARPDLQGTARSLPMQGGFAPPPKVGSRWDEFGSSRRSLSRFEDSTTAHETGTAKRRSLFGLVSLLGKKSPKSGDAHRTSYVPTYGPGMYKNDGRSQSSLVDMTARRIESVVVQDEEFVAYKYPSRQERLDLRR